MKLLIGILVCLILLGVCIAYDTADDTISNINSSSVPLENISNDKNITLVNDTYVALDNNSGKAISDGKIYVDKSVKKVKKVKPKPTITMTGRPSCTRCARNHCSYTWRTKTYLNYCPNCKHWNCLGDKHKRGAVYEKEITCFNCDCDWCVNCGKEKYSWSHRYLKKP